jgi:dihydrolipoamide dehydrogenase
LLPSKVWLTTADSLALLLEVGQMQRQDEASLQEILDRIQQVKERWNGQQAAQLEALDVKIKRGIGSFVAADAVVVTGEEGEEEELSADAFIVATGSVPIFPPRMRPDGRRIIAPRFASSLDELPPRMVVVGAGATGSEFVYLFNRFGVDVTWIVDQYGVLPSFDRDGARVVANALKARGVRLVEGQPADRIETDEGGVSVVLADGRSFAAEMAFLAIGRRPDVGKLNLDAAGLSPQNGVVAVDQYGRSAQPHIYLAGDVTGPPMVANKAMAQAWVAGQHAAGGAPAPFPPEVVIHAIYTSPQLAQVGRVSGPDVETVQIDYDAGLKAHLEPSGEGIVKIAYDGDGRVVGGVAAGAHAADVMAPVAVAVRAALSVHDFGVLYGAHPTISELAFAAARQAKRDA